MPRGPGRAGGFSFSNTQLFGAFGGALALGAVMLGGIATQTAVAQPGPASVVVDFVDSREIAETTRVIGRLVASVESEVAARTEGVIDDVMVEVGDTVRAGQEIVRLDPALHEIERRARAAAVVEAEAGATVATAQLRLAEQALARSENLRGSTAFNQSVFEDLEQRVAETMALRARAFASVEAARADLARADYNLQRTRIYAPFDGVVVEKRAQPGQYINVGAAVGTLLDLAGLEIEADVPSDLIAGLTPGATVELSFEAGETATATMRAIVPRAALSTRTRPVRFTLDLESVDAARLAVGEAATLFVPAGPTRTVVTAPKDALVHSGTGWIVFVVEDGTVHPRPIAIGGPAQDRVEVRSGLAPGDMVVIRGNERLRPGQAVAPRQATDPHAAEPNEGAADPTVEG